MPARGELVLKGINPLLTPPLLRALAEMGHGDEIAVVDRNFPAYSRGVEVINHDALDAPSAIAAILDVLPLDTYVERPLLCMQAELGIDASAVHEEVRLLAEGAEGRNILLAQVERHDFYERCRGARAVVVTGENRPYGCFLLAKGVITSDRHG